MTELDCTGSGFSKFGFLLFEVLKPCGLLFESYGKRSFSTTKEFKIDRKELSFAVCCPYVA
jgi:hypothetical protein